MFHEIHLNSKHCMCICYVYLHAYECSIHIACILVVYYDGTNEKQALFCI